MKSFKIVPTLIVVLMILMSTANVQAKIASMDPDGNNQKLVLDMESGHAKWSEDMNKIAFSSSESTTGRSEIFICYIPEDIVTQLTSYGHYYGQSRPFFVDGNKIWWTWHGPVAGNSEIYSMNLDGTDKTALSNFLAQSKQASRAAVAGETVFYGKQSRSWSPTKEIYSANRDFSNETQWTFNGSNDELSDVNSDGSMVLFYRSEGSTGYTPPSNIFILRPGNGETKLTFKTGNEICGSAYFSPDESRIVYSVYDGSQHDIWMMNVDGSNKVNLTNTPEYNEYPLDWKQNRILYYTNGPILSPSCYTTSWSKSEIPEDTLYQQFPNAFTDYPTSDQTHFEFVDTDSEFGHHIAWRKGALIPDTRGKYIQEAQAAAWYKVLATNMGGGATLEYRYFAYDIVTGEKTNTFAINYQHQYISSYLGQLREWKYSSTMPIDYQLGPNEILGFYTVFHTHGASGVYYEYEYHYGSSQTPTYMDVWYSANEDPTRYYVSTDCVQDEDPFGSIAGTVTYDQSAMNSVPVNLFDMNGNVVEAVNSDENGEYLFEEIGNGDYYVSIEVPLGFQPLSDVEVPVEIAGNDMTVDFELGDVTTGKLRSFWWWKDQLTMIRNGDVPHSGLTADSIDFYGVQIFDHFFDRNDGYGIDIDGLTCVGDPGTPVSFDYLCNFFIDDKSTDTRTKIVKNVLTIMLNVASSRLSQNAVVSSDGATVSQAITHYASVIESGVYTWRDWYYPMKIHSGYTIPGDIIPLGTPNIMYKGETDESGDNLPQRYALSQNYPNPFNPSTRISFTLPSRAEVSLEVYNIMGQRVASVAEGTFEAGRHTVIWDGSQAASGIYFYKLTAGEFEQTRKMVLLK